MKQVRQLAAELGVEDKDTEMTARAAAAMACGFAMHVGFGEYRRGVQNYDEAIELFAHCPGRTWEIDHAQLHRLDALYRLGELEELCRSVDEQLRQAERRGNRLIRTSMCTGNGHMAWLVQDKPEILRQTLADAMAEWSREGFHLQHLYEMMARTQIDLYTGDTAAALRRMEQQWPSLRSCFLLRVQMIKVDLWFLRGRVFLSGLREAQKQEDLSVVDACAKQVDKEKTGCATVFSNLLRAGSAAAKGDVKASVLALQVAQEAAGGAEMRFFTAVAQFRRGELFGGERGQELRDEAMTYMKKQSVKNPKRLIATLAPGFKKLE